MLRLAKRPWVLLALLTLLVGGAALTSLPLMGVPGYELSEAMTLAVGLLGGILGAAAAYAEARQAPRPNVRPGALRWIPLRAVGRAWLWALVALAAVFTVAATWARLGSACDPFAQAWFYPLLTAPAALLSVSVGFFLGAMGLSPGAAVAAYVSLVLASLLWTAWPVVIGPQVYAFNLFLGYFPGPLYDEALSLQPGLLWFEVNVTLWAAMLLMAIVAFWSPNRGRMGSRPRPRPFALFLLLALACATIERHAPALGFRMNARALADRLGGQTETEHVVLHYPLGKPKEEVERLRRDVEFRYVQVRAFLGGAPADKLQVYVYRSPQEKKALVGAGHTQFSKPWQLSVHLNDAPFPHPTLKHELAHAMAAPLGSGPFRVTARWRLWPLMGVVEGLAVAADNPVDELTLHEWAAAMRKQGLAPDLRRLVNPFGFYASAAPRAYVLAGSFLRFLADTYGRDKLQKLYAEGDFDGVYGRPLPELVNAWEAYLDALPLEEAAVHRAFARFHEGSLFQRACAREIAGLTAEADVRAASNPEGALALYRRVAALEPGEISHALKVGFTLAELGEAKQAESVLSEAAQRVSGHASLEAQALLALASVQERAGETQPAEGTLRKVLALEPGADLERQALIQLDAAKDARSREAVQRLFEPGHDALRLLNLELALEQDEDNPTLLYLLGRNLALAHWPSRAAATLEKALAHPLPPQVAREAYRLLVLARFEAGDCQGLRRDLTQLGEHALEPNRAFLAAVDEWRERCDFENAAFHGPLSPRGGFR
jgi:tetratricopeptide (TPR) repeat protein